MPILEEPECLCYWPGLASMQQLVGTYNQAPDLFFLHAEYLMLWFCAQVRCEGLVHVYSRECRLKANRALASFASTSEES